MIRSVLSAVGLVVALAGFGVFAAVGYVAWQVKREADRQLADAIARADAAANAAERVLGLVRHVVDRAEQDLARARAEAAAEPPSKAASSPIVRLTLRQASRELPGTVERTRDAVAAASDVVVVADSALAVLGELGEEARRVGIDPRQIEATRAQLDAAAHDLRSARQVLGLPVPGLDGYVSPEQLAAVDTGLAQARQILGELERVLAYARERVDSTRQQAELWAWRAAAGTTGLCALGALGQMFMAAACWRGLGGRRAGPPLADLVPRDPAGPPNPTPGPVPPDVAR
jgi:hydrogenase maturation protease